MTWKQAGFLILINAILSLLISLVVVTWSQRAQEARHVAATEAAQATAAHRLLATSTSLPRPYVYVVQTGDNLFSIANRFGVSLDELMELNGLSDPDVLQVGQELIIPVRGEGMLTPVPLPSPSAGAVAPPPTLLPWVPTATPGPRLTRTPTPTYTAVPPLDTPTSTPSSIPTGPARVVIVGTRGAGDLARELLLLANQGGEEADLSGWLLQIRGELGYQFPDGVTLRPGGEVALHTRLGEDTATDLYWGLDAPLWSEPGIQAALQDDEGRVVARYPP